MQHDGHTILWIYGGKKKHWTVNFIVNFMICELCSIKKKSAPEGKVGKNAKYRWKFHDGHSSFLIVLSTWSLSSKLFQISKPSSGQKWLATIPFPLTHTELWICCLVYQFFSPLRYIYSAMVSYLFGSTSSFAIMSWVYFFNSPESSLKMVTLSHYSFLPSLQQGFMYRKELKT